MLIVCGRLYFIKGFLFFKYVKSCFFLNIFYKVIGIFFLLWKYIFENFLWKYILVIYIFLGIYFLGSKVKCIYVIIIIV